MTTSQIQEEKERRKEERRDQRRGVVHTSGDEGGEAAPSSAGPTHRPALVADSMAGKRALPSNAIVTHPPGMHKVPARPVLPVSHLYPVLSVNRVWMLPGSMPVAA